LLVGCLALAACDKPKDSTRKPSGNAAYVVDVVTIQPRSFRETLFATGTLLARESVQIQSERAGIVKEISFKEGQPAKASDILLTIDDSELQAQLARAKAQLAFASATESRQRNLLETRGISASEFEQSKANLDIAKAEVTLIESQIAKTRIRAPFDGVTGLRHASVGTYLTPGTAVCTFQDVSSLKLDVSLPERYLGFIKVGQPLIFRIAGQSEAFEATVTAIEPTVDIQTRTLLIRAIAPNEGKRLLPGSFAEVEVQLQEIPDAILIPSIALMPGLQQPTVFVHRDGKVEERKVQVSLRTADTVLLREGLKPGDELITSGILQLRAGMEVRVKPAAEVVPPTTTPTAPKPTASASIEGAR
jgi:membrane fusion protein, multidrug efflux system